MEQQYGAQVQQEALRDALRRSFVEAAQANSLKVAGNPDFEIKTTDSAADQIEYSATFEIYPEVILGDMSVESVERGTFTLNDVDVDNTTNKMSYDDESVETFPWIIIISIVIVIIVRIIILIIVIIIGVIIVNITSPFRDNAFS